MRRPCPDGYVPLGMEADDPGARALRGALGDAWLLTVWQSKQPYSGFMELHGPRWLKLLTVLYVHLSVGHRADIHGLAPAVAMWDTLLPLGRTAAPELIEGAEGVYALAGPVAALKLLQEAHGASGG